MAKYKNGINGPVSGKIGNVVAASYKGIDYLRSVPAPPSAAPSVAQLNQRRLMSMVSAWLKPIKDIIEIGFQVADGNKTPMNLAVSHMMKAGVINGRIDFPNVVFSAGRLLISVIKDVITLADAILHIKWQDALPSAFCKADDQATFIIYNPVKEQFVTFQDAAERVNGEIILQLPASFVNDQVHCWMQYVNAKGNEVSTSVYMGQVVLN